MQNYDDVGPLLIRNTYVRERGSSEALRYRLQRDVVNVLRATSQPGPKL